MDKIEFSDINKFITSLGLIFIGTAIILPWLINENISVLFIESEKIESATTIAQQILSNQQKYFLFLSNNLFVIESVLILLGLACLFLGITRWNKRQVIIDAIQNEELRSKQLQNMSENAKEESIKDEIDVPQSESEEKVISKYIELEKEIFTKISSYYHVNYETLQNMRLSIFEYDIILRSKFLNKRGDLIVDIKYFHNSVSLPHITASLGTFLQALNHYEASQQRRINAAVFIVIFNEGVMSEKMNNYKIKLQDYASENGRNVRIRIFIEQDIVNIEAPRLLSDK